MWLIRIFVGLLVLGASVAKADNNILVGDDGKSATVYQYTQTNINGNAGANIAEQYQYVCPVRTVHPPSGTVAVQLNGSECIDKGSKRIVEFNRGTIFLRPTKLWATLPDYCLPRTAVCPQDSLSDSGTCPSADRQVLPYTSPLPLGPRECYNAATRSIVQMVAKKTGIEALVYGNSSGGKGAMVAGAVAAAGYFNACSPTAFHLMSDPMPDAKADPSGYACYMDYASHLGR